MGATTTVRGMQRTQYGERVGGLLVECGGDKRSLEVRGVTGEEESSTGTKDEGSSVPDSQR